MIYERKEVIGDCTLYLGNCTEVMKGLGAVDAVVTDPPYGIGESNEKNASRGKKAKATDYGSYDWDKSPCSLDQIIAMRSCSKYQIIFGGNYFEGLGPTSCWLVWDKNNGKNDFADCELAWTNLNKAVRKIEWTWNGMIRKDNEKRVHPTQKPLGVMLWCLGHLPEGITVLDPFMGSGTTGVACVLAGRKFVGVELSERYFDVSCERIAKAYQQPDLFVPAPATLKQGDLLVTTA